MSVVVIGSTNCDVVTYADRAPRPGESLTGHRYVVVQGGKGANQATAAARLGARTSYIGRVGADPFGALVLDRLRANGLDTTYVVVDSQQSTGIAVIGVVATGENAITVIPGANRFVSPEQVEAARSELAAARVLLAQLETPLEPTLRAAEIVRAAGGAVVLDPAPIAPIPLDDDTLARFDIATPNELETEALTGILPENVEAAAAAAAILNRRGIGLAIIKMGAKGAYARGNGLDGHIPPFPVVAIDTLAAGDAFNGGLAFALSQGWPLDRCVRVAAACGAFACTRSGASDAAPTRDELERMLASSGL